MKRFLYANFLALIGLFLFSITPVFAVTNPDYLSINRSYVFQSVLETGDQLYYIRYDLHYDPIPIEEAVDTWEVVIYDDMSNLVGSRAITYYQHNILGLYLSAADAIAWEGGHTITLRGNPILFDLAEGVNIVSYTFTPGDYFLKASLQDKLLAEAATLETIWGLTLLGDTGLLNYTGAEVFNTGIPGLSSMQPNMFQTTFVTPTPSYTDWDTPYQDTVGAKTSSLRDAAEGIGSIFGITSVGWAEFWIASLAFLLFAGAVFVPTGNPMFALGVSFPVAAGLAFLGLGGGELLQFLLIVVLILAVVFAVYFILGRFA